jgi:O-antigen/teichoic acid export membrane protein
LDAWERVNFHVSNHPARLAAMTVRSKLLRAAAEYSLGSALGLVGTIVRVGAAARLLPHDVVGLWLGLQLVLSYGQNLHFGVLFGMFRNVPLLRARGDEQGALRVKQSSLGFVLAASALAAVALVVALAVEHDAQRRRYLALTGALTLVTIIKSYYVTLYKGDNRFRELGISSAVGSTVSIATLVLIWSFGLGGLIVGMLAQAATELLYLIVRTAPIRPRLERVVIWEQLTIGFITLLLNVASVLLTSIDRTVMLRQLGTKQTGFYYLGANAIVLLPMIFAMPAAVLTPQFFERVGRGEPLLPLVERPVRVTATALAVLLGVGAFAVPPAVALIWPTLAPGNTATIFALVATYPLVLSGLVTNVFYALNRQVLSLVAVIAACTTSFLVATAATWAHPTIVSAAAGSAFGLFVYLVIVVLAAYQVAGSGWRAGFPLLRDSLLPAVIIAALTAVIHVVAGKLMPGGVVRRAIVEEVVFCALTARTVFRELKALRAP